MYTKTQNKLRKFLYQRVYRAYKSHMIPNARLAQLVKRQTNNIDVGGSIPVLSLLLFIIFICKVILYYFILE